MDEIRKLTGPEYNTISVTNGSRGAFYREEDEEELFSLFDNTREEYQEIPELNSDEWNTIESQFDSGFLGIFGSQKHIFKTEDGTEIRVDDPENVQVLQNKNTGEIIVIGAKDGYIYGSNKNNKISIYDSSFTTIEMKGEKDTINSYNSYISRIDAGSGDDTINVYNSSISQVWGGKGHDDINVKDSPFVFDIRGNKGNDAIIVENSNASCISGNEDDDYIYLNNVENISTEGTKGDDILYIDASSSEEVEGGKGNDVLIIEDTTQVNSISTDKGDDLVKIENGSVQEVNSDDKDYILTTEINYANIGEEALTLDEESMELAQSITDAKTAKYSDRELTPEEQMQALTIDFFAQNLEGMQAQFTAQENEDGWVSDSYNWVKQLTDLGISNDDIQAAIDEQEQMVAELKAALNGETDESFEEVYKKWTGLDYNEENVIKYQQASQLYAIGVNGLSKAENFKTSIAEASDMQGVYDAYIAYYGNEETARLKMNEFLNENYNNNENIITAGNLQINENGEFVVTRTDYAGTTTETCALSEFGNLYEHWDLSEKLDEDKEFLANYQALTGYSFEDIQADYITRQTQTFGKGNTFQKLIDKYCQDQEGFKDKLASVAQIGGMGLVAIGGVVTFVCPPAGVAVMKVGQYTAMAGMLGDNVLDLVDELSSENGFSKEEIGNLTKETLTELALYFSGRGIGKLSNGLNAAVYAETGSKLASTLAEVGLDATLSLTADFIITGEVDLSSEGLSQLLSILTGISGSKIEAYTKSNIEGANKYLAQSGDLNGALKNLLASGVGTKAVIEFGKAHGLDLKASDMSAIKNGTYEAPKPANVEVPDAKPAMPAPDIEMRPEEITIKDTSIPEDNISASSNRNKSIETINEKCPNIEAEKLEKLYKYLGDDTLSRISQSENIESEAYTTIEKIENFQTEISKITSDPELNELLTSFMFKTATWVDSEVQVDITRQQLSEIAQDGATSENTYILAPQPKGKTELKSYTNAARDIIQISNSTEGNLNLNANNAGATFDLSSFEGNAKIIISDDCSVSGASMIEDTINSLKATNGVNGQKTIYLTPTVIGEKASSLLTSFTECSSKITPEEMSQVVQIAENNGVGYETLTGYAKEMYDILNTSTDGKPARLIDLSKNLQALVDTNNVQFKLIEGVKAENYTETDTYKQLPAKDKELIDAYMSGFGQSFGYHSCNTSIAIEGYNGGNYEFVVEAGNETAINALGIGRNDLPTKGNAPNNNNILAQIFAKSVNVNPSRIKISGYTTSDIYFEVAQKGYTTTQTIVNATSGEVENQTYRITLDMKKDRNFSGTYTVCGQTFKEGETILLSYKDSNGKTHSFDVELPIITKNQDVKIENPVQVLLDSLVKTDVDPNNPDYMLVRGTEVKGYRGKEETLVNGQRDQFLFAFPNGATDIKIEKKQN